MQLCAQPGCPVLVHKGRCAPHAVLLEHTRPNRAIRRLYYTQRWIALRLEVLTEACFTCAQCGQINQTLDVDHIVKHDGDPDRFWDRGNLQALCASCHQRKTNKGE